MKAELNQSPHPCPGTVGILSWAATKGCLAILSWLLGLRFAGFLGSGAGKWILAVPASSFHIFCLGPETFSLLEAAE